MDYEKAYKEAIKRAKLELKVWGSIDCDVYKHLVRIFPELAESEDERIRKKLIEAVKGDMVVGGTKDKQRAIAYLEKQKPVEWSEEDKSMIEWLIYTAIPSIQCDTSWKRKVLTRLKSLKPQSHWKPSDEQLDIIEMILTDEAMDDNIRSILETLYNDLKKLREK